jgi:membrane associated rhomboid family serine protease
MFFFPYGTDAPIYYWPYTTVAMIVVNALVFVLEVAHPELVDSLVMETGSGLHPAQWLTANFAHADFLHIAGNIIFLWSFGLIVEGKLGWWKTLIIYLGLGIVLGAVVQTLLLFAPISHGLGASGIVFGFMAISLIWAPANSLQCVFVVSVYIRWIDISIQVFVGLFLALQIAEVIVTGMTLSGAFVHAIGAALGFAVGIWMVKTNRVDCENWDIFSIAKGRHRMTQKERDVEVFNSADYRQRKEERTTKRTAETQQWIHEQIAAGNPKAAAEVYRRVRIELPDWSLPDAELFGLIVALRKAGLFADAIPLMAEHLARYTSNSVSLRMALGEALIRERRPAQALKVLGKLPNESLDARQRQIMTGLREKARKLHEEDPYEVADQDW